MKNPTIVTKQLRIKKSSSAVFITIAIASVLVSISLVFLNILNTQRTFNDRVQGEKEQVVASLESNVRNINTLADSFNQLESQGDLISDQNKSNSSVILDALPSKYDFPAVATAVQNLAAVSGVTLDDFSGSDEELQAVGASVDPLPIDIDFSVSVAGSYEKVNTFMENIEKSIRPINVGNIRIDSVGSNEVRAQFQMTTYYQPTVDLTITTRTIN